MDTEQGFAKENPWVKWFFDDWLNDEDLQLCSFAAQGLWMSILALMRRGRPYGFLQDKRGSWTPERIAGRLDRPIAEVGPLFDELERNHVFSRDESGVPFSRRLVRDYLKSKHRAQAGIRGAEVHWGKTYTEQKENAATDAELFAMANALAKPLANAIASSRARAYDSDSDSVYKSNSEKEEGSQPKIDQPETPNFSESLEVSLKHAQVSKAPSGISGNGDTPPSELGIEGWDELIALGISVGMVMDPDPSSDLCQKLWRHLSFEDKLKRLTSFREKKAGGQYDDPRYVPSLENFVRTKYRESHRPTKPIDRGAALVARVAAEEKRKASGNTESRSHSPPKGPKSLIEMRCGVGMKAR